MFASHAALMTSGKAVIKGSALFAATGTNALTVANATDLQMSTGDFTFETWLYPTSLADYQTLFDKGYTTSGGLLIQSDTGNGIFYVYASGSAVMISSTAVASNAWTHIALVRNGSTLKLYQNGTSVASATNSTNFSATSSLGLGGTGSGYAGGPGGYPIRGYLSNARVVKGTAVYTSTFTPPTSPLTAISGTSLLTCQNPTTIVDNGPNAYSITTTGTVTASSSSPF